MYTYLYRLALLTVDGVPNNASGGYFMKGTSFTGRGRIHVRHSLAVRPLLRIPERPKVIGYLFLYFVMVCSTSNGEGILTRWFFGGVGTTFGILIWTLSRLLIVFCISFVYTEPVLPVSLNFASFSVCRLNVIR